MLVCTKIYINFSKVCSITQYRSQIWGRLSDLYFYSLPFHLLVKLDSSVLSTAANLQVYRTRPLARFLWFPYNSTISELSYYTGTAVPADLFRLIKCASAVTKGLQYACSHVVPRISADLFRSEVEIIANT